MVRNAISERFCSFYAQNVTDNQPNKPGIVRKVSFPEPAGFLAKTVKPLHSDGLHPIRSLFYPSCVEIECGTNPHHERHIKFGNVLRHEPFLLGRAQAYPKDIGSAFLYQAAQGRLFLGSQRSKRCLVGSHNLQSRKARGEFVAQFRSDAICAAIKKMTNSLLGRSLANIEHEVGAVNAAYFPETSQFSKPDHGHSVGCAEKSLIQNCAKAFIALCFHHSMNPGHRHVASPPLSKRFQEKTQ